MFDIKVVNSDEEAVVEMKATPAAEGVSEPKYVAPRGVPSSSPDPPGSFA